MPCAVRQLLAGGAVCALLLASCSRTASAPSAAGSASPASGSASQAPVASPELQASAHPSTPKPAASSGSSAGDAPRGLAPLVAEERLIRLQVEGFPDAVLALPRGITEKRPLLVALHGNYDRPDWQCEVWGELVKQRAFVVCPRGIPRGDAPKSEDRWTYGAITATIKETYAALRAARRAYPEYVDPGPAVFAGFSLGAIYGVHALGASGKQRAAQGAGEEPPFSHAVLIEGGYQGWHLARVKQFHADEGGGVLFACGQYDCRNRANKLLGVFKRGDVPAKVGFRSNVGHTYDGEVAAAIAEQLGWLLSGDARWRAVLGLAEPEN